MAQGEALGPPQPGQEPELRWNRGSVLPGSWTSCPIRSRTFRSCDRHKIRPSRSQALPPPRPVKLGTFILEDTRSRPGFIWSQKMGGADPACGERAAPYGIISRLLPYWRNAGSEIEAGGGGGGGCAHPLTTPQKRPVPALGFSGRLGKAPPPPNAWVVPFQRSLMATPR